jgi:hypothetical protein
LFPGLCVPVDLYLCAQYATGGASPVTAGGKALLLESGSLSTNP